VLLALVLYANGPTRKAYPSVRTLAADTGLNPTTVRRWLALLSNDLGLITIDKPGGPNRATVYRFPR
jgi:DNA-binding transcriptional regulator YhcF (GntR family)